MEADWSVSLAAEDPVVVVPWSALPEEANQCTFVDLRREPHRIDEMEEARSNPALRAALLTLHAPGSPWWTAKCDAWNASVTQDATQGGEAFDPYEMDAEPTETAFGTGSYIDLLQRDTLLFTSFESHERWMRGAVQKLRSISARAARIDLILRYAEVGSVPGFAVSWFVEGCGSTAERAVLRWQDALDQALAVILEGSP